MKKILLFFRETCSGWGYVLYATVCIIMILAGIGKIGDRKRSEMRTQMKAKKKYDVMSGRAAAQAALEGKEVISYSYNESPIVEGIDSLKQKDSSIKAETEVTPIVIQTNTTENAPTTENTPVVITAEAANTTKTEEKPLNNSVVEIDEKKDDVPDVLVLGDTKKE